MTDYADLELGIQRSDAESYTLELRFAHPDSDADVRVVRPGALRLDFTRLNELSTDMAAYGAALGEALFADSEFRAEFEKSLVTAQTSRPPIPVRLRLFIAANAPELQALRWETLRNPQGEPLCLSEQILFSRYLPSADRQPVPPKPRDNLSALVLIANPSGLEQFRLAPVDVSGELERAEAGLKGFELRILADHERALQSNTVGSGGAPAAEDQAASRATLPNLLTALRRANAEGHPYDVLYIVAHGSFIDRTTYLWLEDDQGKIARVTGSDFEQYIRELAPRPRLIMLVACQTSGAAGPATSSDNGVLAALGPRLAEVGVPAVIAMQGNVAMALAARFVPAFFAELQIDGQVDRALAVARGSVRDHADYWAPALYMRFKSGRIWYTPGFGDERDAFEKWPALIDSIQNGECTPIIGSHVSERLLGSSQDIARAWAEAYKYPMQPHEREDLPQVAQFLSVKQNPRFVRRALIDHLRGELLERYGDVIPDGDKHNLNELFALLGAQERERNPDAPYAVLAAMPARIYVTTNASNMLVEALRAANKRPEVEICRWNEEAAKISSIFDRESTYDPSVERPLVFHLFGTFDEPFSLVLTEDDYFDFLLGIATNRDLVPIVVREALADSALLFLGFQLDDWGFRVVLRTLVSQQGRSRRTRYAHIAGQILPQENEVLEPERASRYLEAYFADSADISIYWGSAHDFTRELHTRLNEPAPARRRGRF
jgi:hypothetical protein